MINNQNNTNQNAKVALNKAKSLLDTTNNLLSKKANDDLENKSKVKSNFADEYNTISTPATVTPDKKTVISESADNRIKIENSKDTDIKIDFIQHNSEFYFMNKSENETTLSNKTTNYSSNSFTTKKKDLDFDEFEDTKEPFSPKCVSNTSNTTNSDSNNGSSSWVWWLLAVGIIGWIVIQSNTASSSSSKVSYSSPSQQNYSSGIQSNNYSKTTSATSNYKTVYSLTINTTPYDTKVRILNIKPKYQHGIKLEKGSYHIEVSKDGYETIDQWISLNQDMIYTAELNKIFQNTINLASFDCAKAVSKVENMICTDTEISALDVHMAGLYKNILDSVSDKESIKVQQRNWINIRNECNDYLCLKQRYKEHISKLELIKENISSIVVGLYKYLSNTTEGTLRITQIGNKIKFEIVTINKKIGSICDLSGVAELNGVNTYYKNGEFEIDIMFSSGKAKVSTVNSRYYCGVGVMMDGDYVIKK